MNSTWNGGRNSGDSCSSLVSADKIGDSMRNNDPSSLPSASPNPEEMVRRCDTEGVDLVISTGADERNFPHSNSLQVNKSYSRENACFKVHSISARMLS